MKGSLPMNSLTKENNQLVLRVAGFLDEAYEFPEIPLDPEISHLDVDWQQFKSINSMGVLQWMKWIRRFSETYPEASIAFQNCPVSVVNIFNLIDGFLPRGAHVESFEVPFFCDHCEATTDRMFAIDTPELNRVIGNQKCENEGAILTLDASPSYLHFLWSGPKKIAS